MGIQRRPCEDCGGQLHFDTDQPANAKVGFTLDTYAHVMPGQQADAVKAVAKLVDG